MIFSPYQDCAIYQDEPATFECRICKEVCNDLTFDQNQDTCDDCQNRLALREIEEREKR